MNNSGMPDELYYLLNEDQRDALRKPTGTDIPPTMNKHEHKCVMCGKVHVNCCGLCSEYPAWLERQKERMGNVDLFGDTIRGQAAVVDCLVVTCASCAKNVVPQTYAMYAERQPTLGVHCPSCGTWLGWMKASDYWRLCESETAHTRKLRLQGICDV